MRKKPINVQVLLEQLAFILFGMVMIIQTISRGYLNYVTPRMKPYLLICGVAFIAMGVINFKYVKTPTYYQRGARLFLLLIPAFLFIMPASTIQSVSAQSGAFAVVTPGQANPLSLNADYGVVDHQKSSDGRLTLVSDPNVQTPTGNHTPVTTLSVPPELAAFLEAQKTHPNRTGENADAVYEGTADLDVANRYEAPPIQKGVAGENGTYTSYALLNQPKVLHGYDAVKRHINIQDKEFYAWLSEIFVHPSEFQGYTVSMNGQVYKEAGMTTDDRFLLSRLLMTCCTADLVPTGILVETSLAAQLPVDKWVQIEGKIGMTTFKDQPTPVIEVSELKDGTVPEELYVYSLPQY